MKKKTKLTMDAILNEIGQFTWLFSNQFFVETSLGNFIWSDPCYIGGNNSFTPYEGSYKDYVEKAGIFGRCKGQHIVRDFGKYIKDAHLVLK